MITGEYAEIHLQDMILQVAIGYIATYIDTFSQRINISYISPSVLTPEDMTTSHSRKNKVIFLRKWQFILNQRLVHKRSLTQFGILHTIMGYQWSEIWTAMI